MRAGGNGVRATRERRRAMRSGVALPAQFLMSPEAQFPVSLDSLETLELAELAPDYVDSLDEQSLEQTQELNRLAFPYGGPQWDPVTRTLWHWESAKAAADRLREQEAQRTASAPWDPAAEVIRQATDHNRAHLTSTRPGNRAAPATTGKKPGPPGPILLSGSTACS